MLARWLASLSYPTYSSISTHPEHRGEIHASTEIQCNLQWKMRSRSGARKALAGHSWGTSDRNLLDAITLVSLWPMVQEPKKMTKTQFALTLVQSEPTQSRARATSAWPEGGGINLRTEGGGDPLQRLNWWHTASVSSLAVGSDKLTIKLTQTPPWARTGSRDPAVCLCRRRGASTFRGGRQGRSGIRPIERLNVAGVRTRNGNATPSVSKKRMQVDRSIPQDHAAAGFG